MSTTHRALIIRRQKGEPIQELTGKGWIKTNEEPADDAAAFGVKVAVFEGGAWTIET